MSKGVWERTSIQCPLRYKKSGGYYGRFTVHGKQKWLRLDTDVFSVAKLRLADKAAEIETLRGSTVKVTAGKASVGELMTVYLARTKENPDLRPSSITSRVTALKKLKKTWPGIEIAEPRQITPAAIFSWVSRFKVEGTNYLPPQARTVIKGNSATSINCAIDTLRRILDIAVERGQIHSNPVLVKPPSGRLKKKVVSRKLHLPSMAQIERLFSALEDNGARGGWGLEAADLCRFLTYSGARIGEVPLVTWECVDWERCQLRISGYKTTTSDRFVPLFPALEGLLRKIIDRRKSAARFAPDGKAFLAPTDPILRLRECQKSIDAACLRGWGTTTAACLP